MLRGNPAIKSMTFLGEQASILPRITIATLFAAGILFAVCVPAKPVVGQAGPELLQKVEIQRGQPLNAEQRNQFSRTAANLRDALVPTQQKFARIVAETCGLPEAAVSALLPAAGADSIGFDMSIVAKIEKRRGRGLTPQELQQIRAADNAKKAEMGEIQARYATELARIAGLSREQIQRLLPVTGI